MKVFLASMMLLGSVAAYSESKLTIDVTLNPAGSFQASTQKIDGKIKKSGDLITADKISVKINSLTTGIDLRDEHLWKHLNFKKFQKAILTDLKGKSGNATAFLELAGVKKPITVKYTEDGNRVVCEFKINTKDFNLPDAEYMGIGVEREVSGKVIMEI